MILRPWMLKLQFPPSHILGLFPGFMKVSLILPCAGLFVSSSASQKRAPLIFQKLSCFLLLGPAGPNWTSVPIWSPCCSGWRHTFTTPETPVAAKTTVMISGNIPIRQAFALHVVTVAFLSPPHPRPRWCKLSLSLSHCSQFLCSNRKG